MISFVSGIVAAIFLIISFFFGMALIFIGSIILALVAVMIGFCSWKRFPGKAGLIIGALVIVIGIVMHLCLNPHTH